MFVALRFRRECEMEIKLNIRTTMESVLENIESVPTFLETFGYKSKLPPINWDVDS
jgi:hypothetical protein